MANLKAPKSLNIKYSPSPKQYEVWKALQPECPYCGGQIYQEVAGQDVNGNNMYRPRCKKCGEYDIPELILFGGAAGGGKMLLSTSEVCTPFGFRKLQDLKVGSVISNPTTGGIQKVIYIHPEGEFDFYRIHFVDGTHTDCSEGHLWRGHESRRKTKKAKKYGCSNDRLYTAIELYEWYQEKKKGMHEGINIIIPLTEPIQFSPGRMKTPVDPYVLGAIIGDGCITENFIKCNTVEFVTMDQEILDEFIKAGIEIPEGRKNRPDNQAAHYYIKNPELVEQLKKLGIAGNNSQTHFIPTAYKFASVEDRKRLIQGLMDTDGYVDSRGHMIFTSTSKQLAEDVAFIIRSLGGVATVTQHPSGYRNQRGEFIECNDHYDVQIRTKMNPELVNISRKKELCTYDFNGGNSELGKRIVDVEYIGKHTSHCISVSDPSGLYIADNFTVTHNSHLMSSWLGSSCIRFPGVRMALGRKTLKSLKESTLVTLKDVLKAWGLKEDEHYKVNLVDGFMDFWNGSRIVFLEMAFQPSDPNYSRFGSMEISGAALDEIDQLEERAVEVLFSRIRYHLDDCFKVPKMVCSTNPCVGWVRDRFVQDEEGNPVKCRIHERFFPVSVWDNPDDRFRATYVAALNKLTSERERQRLLWGNWNFVETSKMAAYWEFNGHVHLQTRLRETVYDPLKPLVISLDFNTAPYMSAIEAQFDWENQIVYILGEVIGKPEDRENNTVAFARKLANKYSTQGHMGGIVVTGDPAGLQSSTLVKTGENNFTQFLGVLAEEGLKYEKKVLATQPPHVTRLEFVNAVLSGYCGWNILIDIRSRHLSEDLMYQEKNEDGTKMKKKYLDPKLNVQCERYGHLSDCLDYLLVTFLGKAWGEFKSVKSDQKVYSVPKGSTIYNKFGYY